MNCYTWIYIWNFAGGLFHWRKDNSDCSTSRLRPTIPRCPCTSTTPKTLHRTLPCSMRWFGMCFEAALTPYPSARDTAQIASPVETSRRVRISVTKRREGIPAVLAARDEEMVPGLSSDGVCWWHRESRSDRYGGICWGGWWLWDWRWAACNRKRQCHFWTIKEFPGLTQHLSCLQESFRSWNQYWFGIIFSITNSVVNSDSWIHLWNHILPHVHEFSYDFTISFTTLNS